VSDVPICGVPDPGSAWLPGGCSITRHDLIGFCSNYHGTAHQDGTGLVSISVAKTGVISVSIVTLKTSKCNPRVRPQIRFAESLPE
jgi:hypothetical protein